MTIRPTRWWFTAIPITGRFYIMFAVLLLCAVPALMLLPPLIYLAYISLTMRVTAAVAALIQVDCR